MHDSPNEVLLAEAARTALAAEIDYARTIRKAVFVFPSHEQVVRLIAAAWPVLAAAGETNA